MERIDAICRHPLWRETVAELELLEKDRSFCRHTVEHFIDVARLAYIEALERGLDIPKVQIYAAALLHDIGRACQYKDGTPHDQAGADLAKEILPACGFSEEAQEAILTAISGHRAPETASKNDLSGLLYRADKKSRMCLFCPAEGDCNWPEEKKNLMLSI